MSAGVLSLVALVALLFAYLGILFWAPVGLKRPAQYACGVLIVVLAGFIVLGLEPPPQP
jgi:hypothetical protein